MADLDETIGVTSPRRNCTSPSPAQRIVRIEPAESVKRAISLPRHLRAVQRYSWSGRSCLWRRSRHQARVPFELLGENELIAEIVAETGQDRPVV